MSNLRLRLVILNDFAARASNWYIRSARMEPGAAMLIETTPFGPLASGRPSDGAICALEYSAFAVTPKLVANWLVSPGLLWKPAATCTSAGRFQEASAL